MKVEQTQLSGGRLELSIEVSAAETEPYLERAAKEISSRKPISGFRPGLAPVSVVSGRVGAMALYEEALHHLVTKTLYAALKEHAIESVGAPEISVEKVAPGNPIVYRATVSLLPVVTLGSWRDVRAVRNEVRVTDADVDTMIEDLRGAYATETLAARDAIAGDRVHINFEIRRDGVVIEGGSGTKYPVILGKNTLIPGFEEQLIGMKPGEKKTFPLTFPKPYFQEHLAGSIVECTAEVVSVFERTLPALTDAWSHSTLGKTILELRVLLHKNLEDEKTAEEERRVESAIMDAVIARTTFSDIPTLMLDAETERMLAELKSDVSRRGMQWDDYLKSIKRDEAALKNGFMPHATKRVRGALLLRKLAEELSVEVTSAELALEVQAHMSAHKDEETGHDHGEEFRAYVRRAIVNRKTIDKLLSLLVEKKPVASEVILGTAPADGIIQK